VAIVGRSGIGKSTLLHLLGGLDVPSKGSISLAGVNVGSLSTDDRAAFRGRTVGFVFQFHHLLPEFTAQENVAMPLIIRGVGRREAHRDAAVILERVGLADRMSHRPGELSGGEGQRVAIARALVGKPPILLADEPTGSLDVTTAEEVRRLFGEVSREDGRLTVVVTHSKELAKSMDVVYEMLPGGALVPSEQHSA
jgi:lipoprotein-releasing system ATP-binding protein